MTVLSPVEFWEAASAAFSNETLELTLLPTEQCNLRCSYCYEKFELGKMSPATVGAIQKLMTRRADELRRLKIDWFGGEPLLALDVIEAISAHAMALTAQNPFLDYSASATTNGLLLTEPTARRLSALGLRHFHVSLDGPAEAHDRTRAARGGQPTFAKLERNLDAITQSDIDLHIELRVHVTPLSVDILDEFVDRLAATWLRDPRFTAYFFPIVDLGGPRQGVFKVMRQADAAKAVARLTARMNAALAKRRSVAAEPAEGGDAAGVVAPGNPAISAQEGRNAEGRRLDCGAAYVCYAAKANAWVIRADGRLAKCTVGFDDERNNVGKVLPDGTLEIAADHLRPWMRGWTTGDRLALHCPYEGMRGDVEAGLVESRAW